MASEPESPPWRARCARAAASRRYASGSGRVGAPPSAGRVAAPDSGRGQGGTACAKLKNASASKRTPRSGIGEEALAKRRPSRD